MVSEKGGNCQPSADHATLLWCELLKDHRPILCPRHELVLVSFRNLTKTLAWHGNRLRGKHEQYGIKCSHSGQWSIKVEHWVCANRVQQAQLEFRQFLKILVESSPFVKVDYILTDVSKWFKHLLFCACGSSFCGYGTLWNKLDDWLSVVKLIQMIIFRFLFIIIAEDSILIVTKGSHSWFLMCKSSCLPQLRW